MSCKAHVGDIGTVIQTTIVDCDDVAIPIDSATTMDRIFVNSDGTRTTLSGAFLTDGTDGIVTHTTESGTWTAKGDCCEQIYLVLAAGTWSTTEMKRQIGKKL